MKLPVVHVQWRDSEASNSWTPINEIEDGIETTHSVGLLIRKTKTHILLALSYDPSTESINSHKKIPRCAILKMRILTSITT